MRHSLSAFAVFVFSAAHLAGGTVFFSGNLRTDATVVDCGSGCTLGSSDSDAAWAQWAAFVAPVTLSSDSTVSAITFGYAGGTSGTGAVVLPGGLEPYLSLFDGSGNFLASTFFGTTCPAGANSIGNNCFDVQLDAGTLAAGNYQIALTAWENLSLAENFGSGTLADGFAGLGNLGEDENLNFAFDVVTTPIETTPEPATGLLAVLMAITAAAARRRGNSNIKGGIEQ